MNTKPVSISSIENVSRIIAIGPRDIHYIWHASDATTDYLDRMKARHDYEETHKVRTCPINEVCADYDTDRAYIFCVADCFDPPCFLIFGASFEDAHETFITEYESLIRIDETDLKDYDPETLTYNENGNPVDTESVNGFPVTSLEVTYSPKPE